MSEDAEWDERFLYIVPHLIDWENASGKTALHMACQSGNADLVQVRRNHARGLF
jgi:ankyrin repeat protein